MSAGTGATNIWSTYGVGFGAGSANREDLLDLITNIDPWDTPFYSSAPKVDCSHTTHEWLTDTLAAVSTAGAIEGGDFAADSLSGRTRLNNTTQIFRYDVLVADTQRAVNPAGVRDEYEYQVLKATRQIARNIEATIFKSVSAAQATGNTGTSRDMKGLRGFTTPILSQASTLRFSAVLTIHETVYTSGGNPDSLYVSPGTKADLTADIVSAGGPGRMSLNIAMADRRVIQNIDVMESDFGMLAIIPDRFVPQCAVTGSANLGAAAFLIERSKSRVATLRPVKHTPLGKNGDATRGLVLGELTLEVLHPSANGYIVNVTT